MISQFDYTTLENYDKTEFEIEGTKLVRYTGKNKKVKVPDGVTSIGVEAFKDCDWITEIYIPYGAHDIDYSAFKGCNNIREVEIPIRALKENIDIIKYFGERYKEIKYSLSCRDSEDIPKLPEFFEELGLNETTKEKQEGVNLDINFAEEDPLIKDALNLYLTEMLVTDNSLSRKLHISSDRASDILNFLEKNRFIGPREEKNLARKIYITADMYKSLFGEEPCAVEEKEEAETIEEIEKNLNPALIKDALLFIVGKDKIIYTLLQRKFRITYKTAERILRLFENRGYVGPKLSGGWREVFITIELYEDCLRKTYK